MDYFLLFTTGVQAWCGSSCHWWIFNRTWILFWFCEVDMHDDCCNVTFTYTVTL